VTPARAAKCAPIHAARGGIDVARAVRGRFLVHLRLREFLFASILAAACACTGDDRAPTTSTPPPPSVTAIDDATRLQLQTEYLDAVRAAESDWAGLSADERAERQAQLKRDVMGGE
jgi:hypothetical protein